MDNICIFLCIKSAHISGPPKETILVSAAHCNQICKDAITGQILEVCCCRAPNEEGSCKEVMLRKEMLLSWIYILEKKILLNFPFWIKNFEIFQIFDKFLAVFLTSSANLDAKSIYLYFSCRKVIFLRNRF